MEDICYISFVLQRLTGSTELQNYDISGIGCGEPIDNDIDENSRALQLVETIANNSHN